MSKKFTGLIALMMTTLMIAVLSGCSAGFTSGTWYMEDDDSIYINFFKDGTAAVYDGSMDSVLVVKWTERDGVIQLKYEGETLKLEADGDDTLIYDDLDTSFVKGKYKAVPEFTLEELEYNIWTQEDTYCELTFFTSDDTWEIYNYDEGEYIAEGTFELEDGELTMTDNDDNTYTPKLSKDRCTLMMSKDLVFQLEQ